LKVIALADLHYNIARCRKQVQEQARAVCERGADVLVIAGDTASTDLKHFEDALALFKHFMGRKLLVAGNHDIWVPAAEDSRKRYEQVLPEICGRHGFHFLDGGPVVIDGTGFVGTMGWYDYSFRDKSLRVPMRFYEAKVGPGAAAALRRYQYLLDGHKDVTRAMKRITAIWRDGSHVRLGASDPEFAAEQADRLRRQIDEVAPRVRRIVAALHHLPIRQMAPDHEEPNWRFARAFLGSTCFGEILDAQPKVSYVLAGHSHWPHRERRRSADGGTTEYINIGSGYRGKHEVELEL
jgi:predicted phosphohydrolase